ncbi:DLH domain-containing protein [Balamuthia mandrillaris]
MEGAPSCCPAGSWPALKVDYTPTGTTEDIGQGMQAYLTGHAEQGGKAILVVHDVFGPESGRSKAIADQLAAAGYFVVLPDLFRGDPLPSISELMTWAKKYPAEALQKDVKEVVLPFLKDKGIESVGMIGFCWGSWAMFHFSGDEAIAPSIKCGVDCHPSLILEQLVFEKDPVAVAERVKSGPHLLLPAANDPDFVKEGGAVIQKLQEKEAFGEHCKVVNFPQQQHGWVNRGDVTNEEVRKDVQRALELALEFFKQHL